MDDNSNGLVGSLESRGISVETQIDKNILAPGAAKSVRFRVSKPSGYSSQEVDDFVQNIVVPSVEWYQGALHHRDKAVHILGQALDQAETDVRNLRGQIQYYELNNSIKQGIGRNDDDKEAEALMKRLVLAEAEVARLQAGGSDAVDAETEAYITQITEQYNELSKRYETETNELQTQLDAALLVSSTTSNSEADTTVDSETEAYIAQITEQYNELSERYETETNELETKLEHALLAAATMPVAAPVEEIVQGIDPETEQYIAQITEQYETLAAQYKNDMEAFEEKLKVSATASAVAVAALAAKNDEPPAVDEEAQAYITQITEQYNELMARYTDDIAALQAEVSVQSSANAPVETDTRELEEYVETVTAQYNELIKRYEEDTATLQQQLEEAQNVPAPVINNSETDSGMDAETEAYINQITEQYTELMRRYEEDTAALQSAVEAASNSSMPAASAAASDDSAEDKAYIEELTARYSELVTRYEEDVQDNSGDAALEAENATLKARLAELELIVSSKNESDSDEEAQEKKEARALLLATEDRNRAIDSSKYGNLPPGIRPDDLE